MQGNRLFHIAQSGEESQGLPCEAAQGGGDIAGSLAAEPVESRVAEGCQVVRGFAAEDRAAVFAQCFIADVVQPVFDCAPMVAGQLQQPRGVGLFTGQRTDETGDLGRRLPAEGAFARDLADLSNSGPVEVVIQRGGTHQRATFEATVPFVERAGGLLFSLPLPPGPGGEKAASEAASSCRISRSKPG